MLEDAGGVQNKQRKEETTESTSGETGSDAKGGKRAGLRSFPKRRWILSQRPNYTVDVDFRIDWI